MADLPKIRIKPLFEDSIIPSRAFPTDSGLDLTIYRFECYYLPPDNLPIPMERNFDSLALRAETRALINTGIAATVGPGYEIQIRSRSGLALKQGLIVLNAPGTVDESYRNFLGVIIYNTSKITQILNRGMKIAQMVVCPVLLSDVLVVEDLDETDRNMGGFGHTGV